MPQKTSIYIFLLLQVSKQTLHIILNTIFVYIQIKFIIVHLIYFVAKQKKKFKYLETGCFSLN